ncbi:MAG: Swt1 family HEPN domain-containing protein [Pseudohongiellaceae bacterium]
MPEITVSKLANIIGVPVDMLLSQVKEAGLPHTVPDDKISNEDKSALLMFLQNSHKEHRKAPLKQKTVENSKDDKTEQDILKRNREIILKCLELLPDPMIPFVEAHLQKALTGNWQTRVMEDLDDLERNQQSGNIRWDQAALLKAMSQFWVKAFQKKLTEKKVGYNVRSIIQELITVRNNAYHNREFNNEDTARAIDSMCRLMDAIDAKDIAKNLRKIRDPIWCEILGITDAGSA